MSRIEYDEIRKDFVWRGSFLEANKPKRANFFWDPETKSYRSCNPFSVFQLLKSATPTTKKKFYELFGNMLPQDQIIKNIVNPNNPNLKYFPYQIEGIKFCLERRHSAIIDEMGLGKSIQVIGFINTLRPKNTLIIVPAFMISDWTEKIKKWCNSSFRLFIFKNDKFVLEHSDSSYNDPVTIYLLPDSQIKNALIQMRDVDLDLLVIDEFHRFKNFQAARTQILVNNALIKNVKRSILISGTPMPNRPIELFSILSTFCPSVIGFLDYYNYARIFCDARETKYGIDVNGASNLPILRKRMKQFFSIRRTKKQVLKELPQKFYQLEYIEPSQIDNTYDKLVCDTNMILENEIENFSDLEKIYETESKQSNFNFETLTSYRRELGILKARSAQATIFRIIDQTEGKIVFFAHHIEVIKYLKSMIDGFAVKGLDVTELTGQDDIETRNNFLNTFKKSPQNKVLIASIHACGTGIDLTVANTCVFVEFDWTPAINAQAVDRLHRIGQTRPVIVKYLIFKQTLDEYILKRNFEKDEIINNVI